MNALADPFRDPAFLRALIDVLVVCVIAGVVGTLIVLRGVGFLGDAIAHAIFPGVVVAFLLGGSLLVGALVAGLATAALMGGLIANERVRDNTAIGVIFTAAFALGVVILSKRAISVDDLEGILFGDPLGATAAEVVLTACVGAVVLAVMVVLRRLFVIAAFDPLGARAMGLPVLALDVLLLCLTALTVVVAFKAVGNILVIALLITPAATARLLTDRLERMATISVLLAAVASIAGLYIGYDRDVSPGGTIVLISTFMFFVAWLFAPGHGVLSSRAIRASGTLLLTPPEAEAEVILASPEIREPHAS